MRNHDSDTDMETKHVLRFKASSPPEYLMPGGFKKHFATGNIDEAKTMDMPAALKARAAAQSYGIDSDIVELPRPRS